MLLSNTKNTNSKSKDTVKDEDYLNVLEELYKKQKIIETYMEKFGLLNQRKRKKKTKKKKGKP